MLVVVCRISLLTVSMFTVAMMKSSGYCITVQDGMAESFALRRKWVAEPGTDTAAILSQFPVFKTQQIEVRNSK